jgi:murein DD-endopeptidase MepM/ murein hydrolase activator NlpD
MFAILDHHMKINCGGNTTCDPTSHLYPYLDADAIVVAFNGENSHGTPSSKDSTCIPGEIYLATAPTSPTDRSTDLVIQGCGKAGTGYASYDEHPGYDYYAEDLTPVYAAAPGVVVDNGSTSGNAAARCIPTPGACEKYNWLGIDHGNGYVSQYGHLDSVLVSPGQWIDQSWIDQKKPIALSGHTAPPPGVGSHLHFEVVAHIPNMPWDYNVLHWAIVDPYGWVGGSGGTYTPNGDPLYSVGLGIPPRQLWK